MPRTPACNLRGNFIIPFARKFTERVPARDSEDAIPHTNLKEPSKRDATGDVDDAKQVRATFTLLTGISEILEMFHSIFLTLVPPHPEAPSLPICDRFTPNPKGHLVRERIQKKTTDTEIKGNVQPCLVTRMVDI